MLDTQAQSVKLQQVAQAPSKLSGRVRATSPKRVPPAKRLHAVCVLEAQEGGKAEEGSEHHLKKSAITARRDTEQPSLTPLQKQPYFEWRTPYARGALWMNNQ